MAKKEVVQKFPEEDRLDLLKARTADQIGGPLPALSPDASLDELNKRYEFIENQRYIARIKSNGRELRYNPKTQKVAETEVEPTVRRFLDILNEPLSKEEQKSLGQPAYGTMTVGLFKIFRHFYHRDLQSRVTLLEEKSKK